MWSATNSSSDQAVLEVVECPKAVAKSIAEHTHFRIRDFATCSAYPRWKDRYAALGNGLDVEWSYKDENGTYIKFHRAPGNSPAAVARRLVKGVESWHIFGAETRLLTAYFLGFSGGNIEWLGSDQNSGYEIGEFSLRADEAVTRELKRLNPPPTQEEASLWLDATKNAVHPSTWEAWTTGDCPEEFLLTLRSIAEGVDYDDLTT